jgi:hypothetical protein
MDAAVRSPSEASERVGPPTSSQHRLNDAQQKGDPTETATVPVPDSARNPRATQETYDIFAGPTRSEDVKSRPRVPIWALASIVVVILSSVGGWFILHRPKQQTPSKAAAQSSPTTVSTPLVPATGPAGLTMTSLANMNYSIGDAISDLGGSAGIVNLSDGKGSLADWNASLDKEHVAFGDLDGDGISDAAVVLTFVGPGNGLFRQVLIAVRTHNGKGESTAVKELGDNAVIKSMSVSGGIVTVNMLTVGPNDSMADPETPQVLKLKVRGNKFVPADEPLAALGDAEFTSAQITSHGIQITPGAGFAFYPTFGGNWRITSPGGGFRAVFDAPHVGRYVLVVTHLTSAAPTCPGNGFSPITIGLNSQNIVENYDPAQAHNGSHDFVTDRWTLNLNEGQNLLNWTGGNLCTQYWILHMEIQGEPPVARNGI